MDNYDDPYYLIFAGEVLTVSYWIYRGFLFFDTTRIPPDMTIAGAWLSIFVYQKLRTSSIAYPNLCITQGIQHDPVILEDYQAQLPYTTIGGQRDFDTLVPGEYNVIPFNAAGLPFINKGGITKLCLRGEQNVRNITPPLGTNWVKFYSAQKGLAYAPKLTICYQ